MDKKAIELLKFLKSMSNEKGECQFSLLTLSAERGYIERKKVYCGSSITKLTQKAIDLKL